MKPQIGGSWLCGFPLSPRQTVNCFKEVGLNCCQAVPSRFLGLHPRTAIDKLHKQLPIVSYEDAWRPVNAWLLVNERRKKNPEAPYVRDIILFPGTRACRNQLKIFQSLNPIPFQVVHEMNDHTDGRVLEVNPGLFMSPEEILNAWPRLLAIDLYHIRRELRDDEVAKAIRLGQTPINRLEDWRDSLRILLSSKRVALVHVTPSRDNDMKLGKKAPSSEFKDMLAGHKTELDQMMEIVLETIGATVPFILEFNKVDPRPSVVRFGIEKAAKWLQGHLGE